MKKQVSKLQFITQEYDHKDHLYWVELACKNGVNWIQLRLKNLELEKILKISLEAKKICAKYNSTFIINDYVEIAHEIKADGVHIGKNDAPLQYVRRKLGQNFIIGVTANNFQDVKKFNQENVDYIGLGPFRFTTTKQNIDPILGLSGYKEIAKQCLNNNFSKPIISIGGIVSEDITSLLKTGMFGVAVSSAIVKAKDPAEEINTMSKIIKNFKNA